MKKNLLASFLGGKFMAPRRGSVKNMKFILFLFVLILLYISINFGIRGTKQRISSNEERVRTLRSEYLGKYSRLLHQSKRGEIEKSLEKEGSTLQAPQTPPIRVKMYEE